MPIYSIFFIYNCIEFYVNLLYNISSLYLVPGVINGTSYITIAFILEIRFNKIVVIFLFL